MQGTKTCQNLAYWLEPLVVRQDREACVSVCVCEGVSGVWCVCRCVWRFGEQRGGWEGAKYIVKEMISIEIIRLYTTGPLIPGPMPPAILIVMIKNSTLSYYNMIS